MIPLNDILEKLWGQRYNPWLLGGGGQEGTLWGDRNGLFLDCGRYATLYICL